MSEEVGANAFKVADQQFESLRRNTQKPLGDSDMPPSQNIVEWFGRMPDNQSLAAVREKKQKAIRALTEVINLYFIKFHQIDVLNGEEDPKDGNKAWKLLTFGSFYLYTDDVSSDIDTILCTYQRYLDHDNMTFFNRFFMFLKEQGDLTQQISSLQKVQSA